MLEIIKKYPVLTCGILLGGLTLIPYIDWAGFLWAMLAGFLAVMFFIQQSSAPVSFGKGAKLSLLTGLIGAGLYTIIATPVLATTILNNLIATAPTLQAQAALAGIHQKPFVKYTVSLILNFLIGLVLTLLSTIGGMIAVAVFAKRKSYAEDVPAAVEAVREEETVI